MILRARITSPFIATMSDTDLSNKLLILLPSDEAQNATTLDISNNNLGAFSSIDETCSAFSSVPKNMTDLDISNNLLSRCTDEALFKLFQSIKDHFTSVMMRNNNFGEKNNFSKKNNSGEKNSLADIFKQLSARKLDISKNNLGKLSTEELTQFLATVPAHELDISHNHLGTRNMLDIVDMFKTLSSTVTTLNISNNLLFDDRTFDENLKMLRAIPKTVTKLIVTDEDLCLSCETKQQRAKLNEVLYSNNRESVTAKSAFLNALLPLLSALRQNLLPLELVYTILSFIPDPTKPLSFQDVYDKIEDSIPVGLIKERYVQSNGSRFKMAYLSFFNKDKEQLLKTLRDQASKNPKGASSQTLSYLGLKK